MAFCAGLIALAVLFHFFGWWAVLLLALTWEL